MVLPAKFIASMFKPTTRKSVNMGRMSLSDMKKEYSRQSKVANRRIDSISKAGLYSPAVANINQKGIARFGIKNEGLSTPEQIRMAYKNLMNFLGSTTSTKTGIRDTLHNIAMNFNLPFDGNYTAFSYKTKRIFDLYEDLNVLAQQGQLKTHDKYDIVQDLGSLFDAGLIDENTTANDLLEILNARVDERRGIVKKQYEQLKFNWKV